MKRQITKAEFVDEVNRRLEAQDVPERIVLVPDEPFEPEHARGYRHVSPDGLPGLVPTVVDKVLREFVVMF